MKNIVEKWTGIISGTNRGIVDLKIQRIDEKRIIGTLSIHETNSANFACDVSGTVDGNSIVGGLSNFSPESDSLPKSGNINLTLDEEGKEMKGTWETDIHTRGECILYKFNIQGMEHFLAADPKITLETKDISIIYSTFEAKDVLDIFSIMKNVAKSLRQNKEKDVSPPIYSITYDKEEKIATYDFNYFRRKFETAEKVLYLGFEFKNKVDGTSIYINIHRRNSMVEGLKSNVLVESTNKDAITLIPEMGRGLVSKARNKYSLVHQWYFGAAVQMIGVIVILALSFLLSGQIRELSSMENIEVYSFVALLIIFSNVWTYLGQSILNSFYRFFPVVEILNKPKNKIFQNMVIGIAASISASAIIYLVSLFIRFLVSE